MLGYHKSSPSEFYFLVMFHMAIFHLCSLILHHVLPSSTMHASLLYIFYTAQFSNLSFQLNYHHSCKLATSPHFMKFESSSPSPACLESSPGLNGQDKIGTRVQGLESPSLHPRNLNCLAIIVFLRCIIDVIFCFSCIYVILPGLYMLSFRWRKNRFYGWLLTLHRSITKALQTIFLIISRELTPT